MTSISDVALRPMIPEWALALLAALTLALVVYAAAGRLKGAWLRLAALAALIVALADPALVTEERRPLADVMAIIVDQSGSQDIGERSAQADAAAAEIEAAAARLAERGGGSAPLEVRRVEVSGDGANGTELVTALGEALADVPPERVAGAVLITDGAVSDAARRPTALSIGGGAPAPVHVLLTGEEGEFDRRLVLETAPGFGLVGESVTVRLRADQIGAPPTALGAPRVEIHVDGALKAAGFAPIGRSIELELPLDHGGLTVVEVRLEIAEGEVTGRNNVAAFSVNGVRDRLQVLLVSGEPYAGERTWRNLLKADPSVDLVHFTILRPPRKVARASVTELALIPFPANELFEEKLEEFDLIVFDRYRRWGILRERYIENISDYVMGGGAVLVSTGPAFAGIDSMYRSPLNRILPAAPTFDVLEQEYRPEVTALGARHPVTRGLPGAGAPGSDGAEPVEAEWGRWFRQVEVEALSGDIVMSGVEEKPLLILDRVGQGRVALLASDNVWLWARGYDGGGPQAELLRRLAHWMMKEPELEEEALTAFPVDGGFVVERRSLSEAEKTVEITTPSGETRLEALEPAGPGLWRAEIASESLGVHRILDASEPDAAAPESSAAPAEPPAPLQAATPLQAVAVVGPPAPKEYADPVSSGVLLEPLVATGPGSIRRLSEDGTPDLRRAREGRSHAGEDWIGLTQRGAFAVDGVTLAPLAPSWAFFGLAALFMLAAWRVEGR